MGLQLEPIEFSVVVVGQAHNPSILNPDFLKYQEIIPSTSEWKPLEAITTPPFSRVSFANGISVTVESEKLQVTDASRPPVPPESPVSSIAAKYVETLPHVRYTAVGINFRLAFSPGGDPGIYMRDRFLREGPWRSSEHQITQLGVRLVYPLESGRLVISLDPGEIAVAPNQSERRPSVIVAANFHRNCGSHPASPEVIGIIKQVASDWSTFQAILGELTQ